jgi:hypothetical protein
MIVSYSLSKLYGGKNDNRVFLYGGSNRVYYSDIADGVPSAEYFPVLNYIDIGSSQYDITGLSVQYERLLIHKEKGTWWSQYTYDEYLGMVTFPTDPLNDNIGSTYKGTTRIIDNNPYVLFGNKLYEIVASHVRDDRNAKYISERVQPLLDEFETDNLLTFNNVNDGEYWIINKNKAFVFSYVLDAWYEYEFADNIHTICETQNGSVIGTDLGQLFLMDESTTDNLREIDAVAQTGWLDLGYPSHTKYIDSTWISLYTKDTLHLDMSFSMDMNPTVYAMASIDEDTARRPVTKKNKTKAKKFTHIKYYLRNSDESDLTILSIVIPYTVASKTR